MTSVGVPDMPDGDPTAPATAKRRRSVIAALIAPALVLGILVSSGALPSGPASTRLGSAGATPSGTVPPGAGPSAPAGPSGQVPASLEPSGATPRSTTAASAPAATPGGPSPSPAPGATGPPTPSPRDPGDYLLMPRSTLLALPTSGPAWEALLAVAGEDPGRPDLTDQDSRHGVQVLAAALVYARTGEARYGTLARAGVMAAIGTERRGADNSILALGRQLAAYVLAADFAGLSGADDARFRAWLDDIRTRDLGGHGRWTQLTATHEDAANNWGAFAGASRIAASLYLGDGADAARAARVLRGFLGERAAWSSFQPVDGSRDWACTPDAYTPVNPPCSRDGIDLDGAIVRDISRGGGLDWPPGEDGIRYTLESMQGLVVQAELLRQNGVDDPWRWSDAALGRAAQFVSASGRSGGDSWNRSPVTLHLPWIINARYGLSLPTEPAGFGRILGYTDWLYGS